jgi:hypothetical protein
MRRVSLPHSRGSSMKESMTCEKCGKWTTRSQCATCSQRVCRACAPNHKRRTDDPWKPSWVDCIAAAREKEGE